MAWYGVAHSFHDLLYKYLLKTYHMAGIVLTAEKTLINKTDEIPTLPELTFERRLYIIKKRNRQKKYP